MTCSSRTFRRPRCPVAWGAAGIIAISLSLGGVSIESSAAETLPASAPNDDLQIEINKKGLGKEVVIHKGAKEWYLLVEVAEGNTVVIRQEKEGDTYLLDESETHDRALSKGEIDGVIEDFINSVKTRNKNKK